MLIDDILRLAERVSPSNAVGAEAFSGSMRGGYVCRLASNGGKLSSCPSELGEIGNAVTNFVNLLTEVMNGR